MRSLVFLFDVDNTLLNNDQLKGDLSRELRDMVGPAKSQQFWETYEAVRIQKRYVDFPTTIDRFSERVGWGPSQAIREMIYNLPFHAYLYQGALDAVHHANVLGSAVILSDGDPVFQRLKVDRSGLSDLFAGRVLLTVSKEEEFDAAMRAYPADRYVLVDDKSSILAALGSRRDLPLTTVLVCQGKYANPEMRPAPDLAIQNIADFAGLSPDQFLDS